MTIKYSIKISLPMYNIIYKYSIIAAAAEHGVAVVDNLIYIVNCTFFTRREVIRRHRFIIYYKTDPYYKS